MKANNPLVEGFHVFVYFNLIKKLFSVRDLKTKKVIAHLKDLTLTNASFKVSQAGRVRVLNEKQKNVHVGVQGFYSLSEEAFANSIQVTYNPYRDVNFVEKLSGEDVYTANKVRMEVIENKTFVYIIKE